MNARLNEKKIKKRKSGRAPRKIPCDNKTLNSCSLFASLVVVIFVKQ